MEVLPEEYFWAGLLVATVLGMSFGSYATSLIYRLPEKKLWVDGRVPYCPSCDRDLETRDLFPLISYVINRAKCRFCGARIPTHYTIVELCCTASSILAYLLFSFSQFYVIWCGFGCCLTILASIWYTHRQIDHTMLVALAMLGIMYRLLVDGNIGNLIIRPFAVMVLGLAIQRQIEQKKKTFYPRDRIGALMVLSLWIG